MTSFVHKMLFDLADCEEFMMFHFIAYIAMA